MEMFDKNYKRVLKKSYKKVFILRLKIKIRVNRKNKPLFGVKIAINLNNNY